MIRRSGEGRTSSSWSGKVTGEGSKVRIIEAFRVSSRSVSDRRTTAQRLPGENPSFSTFESLIVPFGGSSFDLRVRRFFMERLCVCGDRFS